MGRAYQRPPLRAADHRDGPSAHAPPCYESRMERSHRARGAARRAPLFLSFATLLAVAASQTGCPVHEWDKQVQDWREKQKVPGAATPAEEAAPKSSAPASAPSGGTMVIPGGASSSAPSAKPTDTKL